MRGVIMETKNGRAVLLTKGGEFVNIKDKNYSVGDKVNITLNTGRLCAMAASLVIVCAGIGSYFMPAGYVSVDINPSLIMTINIYNRVIDVKSLNDDASVLLNKIDIKGKSAEDSVEMLIKTSEEIGYINDNNHSVILDVVSGITKPHIENVKYNNIDITKETADMETFRTAQNIGVSIAKVKALEEYTEKNGGDIHSNAAKFNDKSVKEIRNIMIDDSNLSDKKSNDMPLQNPKPQEVKPDNISEPPKPRGDYRPPYNINNNSFPISESKRKANIPPANKSVKNMYRPPENIQVEDRLQEILPDTNKSPHLDITQISQPLHIEPKPPENVPAQDNNTLQNKPQQTGEPEKEKSPVESIQTGNQDNVSDQGGSKPQNGISKPNKSEREDNKPSDNGQQITEQQLQNSIPNNSIKSDGQKPDVNMPSDKQQPTEKKQNSLEQGNDKPHSNSQPSVPKHEETPSQNNTQPSEPNRNDGSASKPDVNVSSDKQQPTEKKPNSSEQGNDKPHSNSQPSVPKHEEPPLQNNPQSSKPKQENNTPSQAEQKPSENMPTKENPIRQDGAPQPSEPNRNDGSAPKAQSQSSEPKPKNNGGNNMANEGMSGHSENNEMP